MTAFDMPPSRAPLLHFTPESLSRWQLQTDAPVGGFSECTLEPVAGSTAPSRALWSGRTSLDIDRLIQQQYGKSDQKAVASKVGFVSMMHMVEENQRALDEFHGLCLTCRPRDARNYVLTVRSASTLGEHRTEDLYQVLLAPFLPHAKPVADVADVDDEGLATGSDSHSSSDSGGGGSSSDDGEKAPLIDVRVPWGALTLTWRGYVQGGRPPAMNLRRINAVGLLLADKAEGEFGMELAQISAFRFDEEEAIRDGHVRQCLELNRANGYDEVEALS